MNDPNTIETRCAATTPDAADAATGGSAACCGAEAEQFGAGLYDTLEGLPDAAALASIGCGNPVAVADLHPGEVVLDLGSGGGIDVLLSARRVGPSGKAYGVDFTAEMLDLARRNAVEAGATNVEFLEGRIDAVPLPDGSVDVIISNCVINLSADKQAVFAEMHRLLAPRWSGRRQRRRHRGPPHRRRAGRAGQLRRLHRRRAQRHRVPRRTRSRRLRPTCRSSSPTAVGDGVHAAIVRAVKPRRR